MSPSPRRRGARRAVLALLLAALAAALLAPAVRSATPARCGTFSLLAELRHPTAGAGSRFVTLVLTNVTRRTCTLKGYPGLRLLGPTNLSLPTRVVRVRPPAPRLVVLAPGASARSALRFGALPGPGEPQLGRCEPAPARLRVAPPGGAHPIVVPWRLGPVCEHGRIEARALR